MQQMPLDARFLSQRVHAANAARCTFTQRVSQNCRKATIYIAWLHCLSLLLHLSICSGITDQWLHPSVQSYVTNSRPRRSVLNHCLQCFSSFNTHLSHSRPWFKIQILCMVT